MDPSCLSPHSQEPRAAADRTPSWIADPTLFQEELSYLGHSLSQRGVPKSDRDELAQKVVIAAYERRHDYDPSLSSLRGWLQGFVRNIVRNYKRSKRTIMIPLATLTPEPIDKSPGPEERTVDKAYRQLLREVLLPQVRFKARVVVIAHEFEGLDFKAIAARENIPLPTAYDRYRRGIRQLKAAYARYQNDQKAQGLLAMPFTLAQLLAADRTVPALPPAVLSRIWSQVEHAQAPQVPWKALRALRKRPALFLVPAFLAGAAVGAALCAALQPPPRPAVIVQPEPAQSASVGVLGTSAPLTPLPPAAVLSARPGSSSAARRDFRDAKRDFEVAYQAFVRGDYDVALAALAAQEHDYPAGAFAGERRILRAQIAELRAASGPARKADPEPLTEP